jgi:dienelactone hydrolase
MLSLAVMLCLLGVNPIDKPISDLPSIKGLPNPFLMNDGSRVRDADDWAKRRAEITEMLLYYEYGHIPPAPDNLKCEVISSESSIDGKATLRRLMLTMGPENKLRMEVALHIPSAGTGPFPVLLALEPVWDSALAEPAKLAVERGYVFAGYDLFALDKDDADRSDGVHPIYPDYDWATIAAWAWGAMRTVDYLVGIPEVDAKKIAITGHSRRGKTALLAAALDTRIALAAPHCSGAGGSGSFRIPGKNCETLELITAPERFHYWFHPRLREFVGKEDKLPFDQHFLKALVAPRCIVSMEGLEDHWANPLGSQQIWRATKPVYDFLGAPENNVFYIRPGGHPTTKEDWIVLLDYCDHFMLGKPLMRSPSPLPFPDAKKAFSWKAPKVSSKAKDGIKK